MFDLRLDANGDRFRVTRPMPMGWHSSAGSADYDAIAYGTPHLAKINDQEIMSVSGVRKSVDTQVRFARLIGFRRPRTGQPVELWPGFRSHKRGGRDIFRPRLWL